MLRTHKKLTKKELKQDPLVIFTAQVIDFLRDEWMKIVASIAAVVIIVGVGYLIVHTSRKNTINAYDAAITAVANNAPEAHDLLKRIVDEHGGSDYAGEALIKLANDSIRNKELDNAEKYYQEYVDSYKDPIYLFNAYNGLGAIYEEKGDFKKAGETYEKYLLKNKASVFSSMMYLNAGKAFFQSGDKEKAKQQFMTITEKFADSKESQEAQYYLGLMN